MTAPTDARRRGVRLDLPDSRRVSIRYDGRHLPAFEGEPLAAALYAAGVRIFNRSLKYHRPRGLFCNAGYCPNCLVRVDGTPHVRACTEPVRDRMEVESESGWPSARFDLLAVLDQLGFLFPTGFQYRYFTRPRWLYHRWEWLLRRLAGHGRLGVDPPSPAQRSSLTADVAVVGGGPAGMAAALAAARAGACVLLFEAESALGGGLRTEPRPVRAPALYDGLPGVELVARLATEIERHPAISCHRRALAFGYYADGRLGVAGPGTFLSVHAERIIVATGSYERPMVFDGCDRPGVFLASGVRRMLHLWRIRPGAAAVVVTTSDYGLAVALDLLNAGVTVRAVADTRDWTSREPDEARRLRQSGVTVLPGHAVLSVAGRRSIRAAILALTGPADRATAWKVPCDHLVVSGEFWPANELVFHAAYRGSHVLRAEAHPMRPQIEREGLRAVGPVHIAGNAAGVGDLVKALLEGTIAGLSAGIALRGATPGAAWELEDAVRALAAIHEASHGR